MILDSPSRHSSDLARTVRKFDLDDLCFRAGDSLAIEGCFSGRWTVHDETCYSFSTDGERVQPEDVHIAIGECPANFAERAGRIIHKNGEFFADWHRDLLFLTGNAERILGWAW